MSLIVASTIESIQKRLDSQLSPTAPQRLVSIFLDASSQPQLTMIERYEILDHFITAGYHCVFNAPSMRLDISLIIHRADLNISSMMNTTHLTPVADLSSHTPYERDEMIRLLHHDGCDPQLHIGTYHVFINGGTK